MHRRHFDGFSREFPNPEIINTPNARRLMHFHVSLESVLSVKERERADLRRCRRLSQTRARSYRDRVSRYFCMPVHDPPHR